MIKDGLRRVVVTGLGAVTPLGVGARRSWKQLIDGKCGITTTKTLGDEFLTLPSQVAGLVPLGSKADGRWTAQEHVSTTEARQTAKFAQYALAASEEALQDAGFPGGQGLPVEETGVCLGSGIGNLEELYDTSLTYSQERNYRKIHPLFVPRLLINLGAGHISMRYGLLGPNHAATTACTTGAHSIGDALRFIQHGDAKIMLAGGAESCIHPLAIGGFARSRSLSTDFNDTPERASRPFDRDRAGFVISEGAAVLVLEDMEHAIARNADIYAELVGYGCSADAYHLTAPRESGVGALLAMKRALQQAQISPSAVDYVNAHATSTPIGDAAENKAIVTLMNSEGSGRRNHEINISSTKGATGHLLGAAGALEALFTVLAIHENTMPPTLNLLNTTSDFGCNYAPLEAQRRKIQIALTNSFGFGGTNASLCFCSL